jgi:hypothetical protein
MGVLLFKGKIFLYNIKKAIFCDILIVSKDYESVSHVRCAFCFAQNSDSYTTRRGSLTLLFGFIFKVLRKVATIWKYGNQ